MSKPSKSWIPSSNPSPGMNVPFDRPNTREWNVNTPKMSPNDSQGNPTNRSNAMLISGGGKKIGLWVNNITTDFSLSGSVAQSQNKQQFFPHNFTQPTISISGQSPNGYEFGRLGEVVRESHKLAIDDGDRGLNDQYRAVKFVKYGKDYVSNHGGEAGSRYESRAGVKNRNTKGRSSKMIVYGYIANMNRGTERHLVAFDWSFELIVLKAVNFMDLRDDGLNGNLIKVVRTIEDSLSKADKAVPETDPFKAYADAQNGGNEPNS